MQKTDTFIINGMAVQSTEIWDTPNLLLKCLRGKSQVSLSTHGTAVHLQAPLLPVSLEHKTSHKQHRYICSNSQKYIVWVKIVHFSLMPKIIRILSKDHVP